MEGGVRVDEESGAIQRVDSVATSFFGERTKLESDPTVVIRARENEKRSMHKVNMWRHCL